MLHHDDGAVNSERSFSFFAQLSLPLISSAKYLMSIKKMTAIVTDGGQLHLARGE